MRKRKDRNPDTHLWLTDPDADPENCQTVPSASWRLRSITSDAIQFTTSSLSPSCSSALPSSPPINKSSPPEQAGASPGTTKPTPFGHCRSISWVSGWVCERHCITALKKHVLPRLARPFTLGSTAGVETDAVVELALVALVGAAVDAICWRSLKCHQHEIFGSVSPRVPGVSVADPDVFRPPGSGFTSQRYGFGSGSGSLYHQAKVVSKTLIPTVLWLLFNFLSMENDVNVPSKINKQKNLEKVAFCWHIEGQWRKYQDLDRDPLVRARGPRIRNRNKMLWIRNTAWNAGTLSVAFQFWSFLRIFKRGFYIRKVNIRIHFDTDPDPDPLSNTL